MCTFCFCNFFFFLVIYMYIFPQIFMKEICSVEKLLYLAMLNECSYFAFVSLVIIPMHHLRYLYFYLLHFDELHCFACLIDNCFSCLFLLYDLHVVIIVIIIFYCLVHFIFFFVSYFMYLYSDRLLYFWFWLLF